jgi:hypothetical protein
VPTPDGDLAPFCGYNMTTEDGEYAIRNRNDWGGREAVDDPLGGEYGGDADSPADGRAESSDVTAPDGGCTPDSDCCGGSGERDEGR